MTVSACSPCAASVAQSPPPLALTHRKMTLWVCSCCFYCRFYCPPVDFEELQNAQYLLGPLFFGLFIGVAVFVVRSPPPLRLWTLQLPRRLARHTDPRCLVLRCAVRPLPQVLNILYVPARAGLVLCMRRTRISACRMQPTCHARTHAYPCVTGVRTLG